MYADTILKYFLKDDTPLVSGPSDSSRLPPQDPTTPFPVPRLMVSLTDKLLSIRQCVPTQPWAIPFLVHHALGPPPI